MPVITINGNSLNLRDQIAGANFLAVAPHTERASIDDSKYILLHTSGPLSASARTKLVELDVDIHSYVNLNTYLCEICDGINLKEISSQVEGVLGAYIYHNDLVIESDLKSSINTGAASHATGRAVDKDSTTEVSIGFHHDVDPKAVQTQIAAIANVDQDAVHISGEIVRLVVKNSYLNALAALESVCIIEKHHPKKLTIFT